MESHCTDYAGVLSSTGSKRNAFLETFRTIFVVVAAAAGGGGVCVCVCGCMCV